MLCICSSFAKSKTVSTSDSFAIAKLAIDLPYVSANGKPVLPIRYECASAKKTSQPNNLKIILQSTDVSPPKNYFL